MPVDTPVDTPSHTPMDPPVDDASAYAALLGGFRLTVRGRPVTAWRAGKSQALFQYLVLHRDRPVHRDRLRAELWPHLVPPAGATSVKAAVHGVRRVLRPLARGAAPVELRLTRDGYLLTGDGLRTDVDDFLRAVRAGDTARHARDFDAAAEHYRRALREIAARCCPRRTRRGFSTIGSGSAARLCVRRVSSSNVPAAPPTSGRSSNGQNAR